MKNVKTNKTTETTTTTAGTDEATGTEMKGETTMKVKEILFHNYIELEPLKDPATDYISISQYEKDALKDALEILIDTSTPEDSTPEYKERYLLCVKTSITASYLHTFIDDDNLEDYLIIFKWFEQHYPGTYLEFLTKWRTRNEQNSENQETETNKTTETTTTTAGTDEATGTEMKGKTTMTILDKIRGRKYYNGMIFLNDEEMSFIYYEEKIIEDIYNEYEKDEEIEEQMGELLAEYITDMSEIFIYSEIAPTFKDSLSYLEDAITNVGPIEINGLDDLALLASYCKYERLSNEINIDNIISVINEVIKK